MVKGTIKSKRDIERLFQNGRRSSSSFQTILVLPRDGEDTVGRCAFIAGKKLGPAPFRNRCKRVMRSACASCGGPWEGYDVAFIARRSVARANAHDIVASMQRQLVKLGVCDT